MLKDKIIEIVKTLSYLTDNKIINWTEEDPNSSYRNYKRKMLAEGEDGTKYEMEVKFLLKNDNWVIDDDSSLWVKNKLLPDSMMLITSFRSDGETLKLRDSILQNFCTDMKPSIEIVEDILTDIAKGISITEFREGRLNKILN